MQRQSAMYAVAVRDGDLYLVLRIRRNPKGEVFVMFPGRDPKWDPHASYHADGAHHQKSHDRKFHVRKRATPDAAFPETVNLVTTGIARSEPRAINALCKPDHFADVFEIPLSAVGVRKYTTNISVDLTPPGSPPIIAGQIISQKIFKDAVPWIVVTLSDSASLK